MNLNWLAWLSLRWLLEAHFTFLFRRLQWNRTSVILSVYCIGQHAISYWWTVAVGASLESFDLFYTKIYPLTSKFHLWAIHPCRIFSTNRIISTRSSLKNALIWLIYLFIASLTFIYRLWFFFCIRLYWVSLVDTFNLGYEVRKEGSLDGNFSILSLRYKWVSISTFLAA